MNRPWLFLLAAGGFAVAALAARALSWALYASAVGAVLMLVAWIVLRFRRRGRS